MRTLLIAALLITSSQAQELEWLDDFEEAKKSSQLADLPIFLMIVRTADTDCKKQLATFQEEKANEFLNNFILCQLNAGTATTVKFMNRNGIRGAAAPFKILFGRDNRTKMMAHGGYLRGEEFLEMFKPALEQIEQGPTLTPAQMITEYMKRSQKSINEKRYKLALLNIDKAIAQANKLNLKRNAEEYTKRKAFVDQYGQIQMLEAKKQMKAGDTEHAIGIAKRVAFDFGNRAPALQAQEFLAQQREKIGEEIDTIKALPEGYQKPIDAPEEGTPKTVSKTKSKPKSRAPKNLVKLTLKDGTTLIGNIVTRSGGKLFFKVHSDNPKQRKSKFITAADVVKEEKVE